VESLTTVMNATQTTLSNAPGRWQRGIVRALLLMGAFADMTFGGVAYAQITFKDKSSAAALQALAAPIASPGTTSTITFVGEARMPTVNDSGATANNVTITPPGGMAADDLVVVYVAVRDNSTAQTINGVGIGGGNTGGQTWTALVTTQRQNNVNLRIFHCKFNGTWSGANPSFSWANSNSYQVWMVVFRGVDTTTAIDAGPNIAQFGAATNILIPAGTLPTVTNNAMVIASWHSADNNTWGSLTAGWLNPNNVTHWRTSQGDDSSSSIGYKVKTTGTGSEAVTNLQSGSDAGIRSILALRPATNRLTITKPTGTVAGDVLIASIGFRPSCCDQPAANYTIAALDAGWTALPRLDNAPGAGVVPSNSLAVYWKVAGASEPAAYRWSFSVVSPTTFDAAAGGILKFSGVDLSDTNTPIITGVEENGRQTTAGDQATPSITTTATNTMLVTSHSYASPTTAPWTEPTGMTAPAAVDVKAGGLSTAIFYGVQSVVGPTGQKRAIPTPDDDIGNAHILALRSATPDTALTIPIPPSTVAGDVMVAAITVRGADRSITPPPAPFDWVEVRPPTDQTTGTANLQVFYVRAAGASEPTDYTWTLAAGNTGNVGGILSFSGVDTTAPIVTNAIDASGGNLSSGTGGAITANSINTNVADTVAVSAHSFVSTANWSAAAPAVEDVDLASRHVPRGDGISLAMYHYPAQAIPGATGDKTATASNDFDTGIGQILALKPPPPAPAVGGFNAYETSTAAGAITGVIKTKIAGSTASVDMIALNAAKTAIATGFTGTVRVEVLNASDNSGAPDANGCRPTWTVIQTLSPDPAFIAGDNGRKTISFTQANSFPNARLRITYPAGAPTVTGCSNDNFAIRPNAFASFAVTDTDWQTAGTVRTLSNTGATGGNVHKAGRPFTVRADAVNGAGTPAVTTNYTGTPTVGLSDCGASSACPATFGTFAIGASFSAGQLTSNVADYSEVGSFSLQLVDSTFSSVDTADGSTPAERDIASSTINVGRFVPDHFDVTSVTAPVFRTFNDAACATRSFTYIGQRFGYATIPAAMIAAKNSSGGTTTNYTGALWKLTNASASQTFANSPVMPLDTAGIAAPTVSDTAGTGTGTYTANASDAIAFVRDSATPQAPFNSNLSLTLSVSDASEAGASQGTITTTTPLVFSGGGAGIAFDSGNAFRYGRLVIRNANGSQLVPLPVQVEAQYWSGAPTNAFITNTQDSCTPIASANVAMSNFTPNLAACETAISGGGVLSAGRRTLQLAAPGSANNGSVDLTVNLGASASGNTCTAVGAGPGPLTTPANLPYLQGNWTGGTYTVNPSARAAFGVFKGAEEVIFQRENF
jgi:hypothetical protein